jgi:hypothetical protein
MANIITFVKYILFGTSSYCSQNHSKSSPKLNFSLPSRVADKIEAGPEKGPEAEPETGSEAIYNH